jgi:hypothetical protein
MKKIKMILVSVFILSVVLSTQARDVASDFFVGKWSVDVKGTPSGDIKLLMTIAIEDDKWLGYVSGTEGEEKTKFDRVEVQDDSITVYWFTNGYDVYINFKKSEDNKLKGALMGMFDATAERVVE